ncbi:MAG: hypothetical protein RJB16_470, partial [Bacteroidota bacterium]
TWPIEVLKTSVAIRIIKYLQFFIAIIEIKKGQSYLDDWPFKYMN